jgi:mRNA-degrading endonuclease toxin of MazEF toxin-antitoxin module
MPKYQIIIYWSEEDGVFVAEVPELPGCAAHGQTTDELPPPVGSRPVLILTRDAVLHSIDSIVVALVTRTVRGIPTEVALGRREGLPTRCVANLDNVLTVSRHRLIRLNSTEPLRPHSKSSKAEEHGLRCDRRGGRGNVPPRVTPFEDQ